MLPKMMLAFVVRRCAVQLGREPTPEEFAHWANNYAEDGRTYHLFGKPITAGEASVILRHPARMVTTRGATGSEQAFPGDAPKGQNVTCFHEAVARLRARAK